jgi:hypothetical protein
MISKLVKVVEDDPPPGVKQGFHTDETFHGVSICHEFMERSVHFGFSTRTNREWEHKSESRNVDFTNNGQSLLERRRQWFYTVLRVTAPYPSHCLTCHRTTSFDLARHDSDYPSGPH